MKVSMVFLGLVFSVGSNAFAGPGQIGSATTHDSSTICLVQPDASKSAFESEKITVLVVDANGNRLLSAKAKVSAVDSAPFSNVIKTYSQEDGSQVIQVLYVNGSPSKLISNEGEKEIPLIFNDGQTTAQGAACYDVQK